jgi:hypothetical protein
VNNRTVRVILDPPVATGNESEDILGEIVSLGCGYEGANKSYIAVNIPPSADKPDRMAPRRPR